jgi:hypothetical protein
MNRRPASAALLCLAFAALQFGWPAYAAARVQRFALIVGNNRGLSHEAELRYAQTDAEKVHATLRDIGSFDAANLVLLRGGDANGLRRALLDLNVRLRAARSVSGTETVLFVYYSGHADLQDLHLGESRFAIAELSQLVRGSAADFRLMVLDACRSGVLTHAKGGHMTQPFDIPEQLELSGEGLAFLTASADDEIAQESDELRGSFFTHAFVSGLLGAADRDRDGNVALDEAYQFAYDNTLRSSSRSAAGLQHPTFFYDLRGQGRLVLTHPFAQRSDRGLLELPKAAVYLVFRGGPEGQVTAEVPAQEPVRTLSLAPGIYFLRGRATTHALEGDVRVEAGRTTRVDSDSLTRIDYAHLARKGGAPLRSVQAIEMLAQLRAVLPNADTPCYGALAGYRLDTPLLAWSVRAGACSATRTGQTLSSRTNQFDLGLRVTHAFDLSSRLSLDVGVGISGAYFEQRFETNGLSPTRRTWAGAGELSLGFSMEIAHGTYATLEAVAQSYLLPMLDAKTRQTELQPAASGRLALGCGRRF